MRASCSQSCRSFQKKVLFAASSERVKQAIEEKDREKQACHPIMQAIFNSFMQVLESLSARDLSPTISGASKTEPSFL
ncbi:unnamed protein product [Lasius platythorax]|uniref:Uncharacterized protein n=1 Tax=Lasius platythorax TaxID=488582 RepID=A0AAV2NU61_9HYME